MVETAENSGNRAPARSQNVKAQRPRIAPGNPLPNAKYELFAQAISKGAKADEAYVAAGFASNRGNACRLKATESVKQRVRFLQTEMARQTIATPIIDKAYVLRQSVSLHERCMAEDEAFNPNAAARALDMIGRHVDVQAFREAQDINVHITVDQAIARLESQAIDADYEVIDGD
jgi:hypothetical protein